MYSYYSVNIYYKNLLKKIHKFINKITPGLYNLKKTYTDNKEIKAHLDSIILTMLDFKNEILSLYNASLINRAKLEIYTDAIPRFLKTCKIKKINLYLFEYNFGFFLTIQP